MKRSIYLGIKSKQVIKPASFLFLAVVCIRYWLAKGRGLLVVGEKASAG